MSNFLKRAFSFIRIILSPEKLYLFGEGLRPPLLVGLSKYAHDVAVDRIVAAGAVPHTTTAPITEWFRDWDSPLAPAAREIFTPFLKETKELTFAIVIAATNWL